MRANRMVYRDYRVEYKMYQADNVHAVIVKADTKEEAYDKAFYEAIPAKEDGCMAYSAWVESVNYVNGKFKRFNTFEGKPY